MDDAAAGTGPACLRAAHTRVDIIRQSVWSQANVFSHKPCFSAAMKGIFRLPGPPVGCWRAAVSPAG